MTLKSQAALVLIIVGAFLILIASYSTITGHIGLSNLNINSQEVTQGDKIAISAQVDNQDKTRESVWLVIWDKTGGVIWQGFLNLVSGENTSGELWSTNISTNAPPFPEINGSENFNYTVYANYQNGLRTQDSGTLTIRERNEQIKTTQLKKGWNMVSFTSSENQDSAPTDRKITLYKGWNLIGYSSNFKRSTPKNSLLINDESMNSAIQRKLIQNQFSYYDSNKGAYQLVSSSQDNGNLLSGKSYWVYSNENNVILTFRGVGGNKIENTIPLSELKFKNEKTQEIMQGLPIGLLVQKYDAEKRLFSYVLDEITPWKGYFIYSPNDDYSLITN